MNEWMEVKWNERDEMAEKKSKNIAHMYVAVNEISFLLQFDNDEVSNHC